MKKAAWSINYDRHTDQCYECPCCDDCKEPVIKDGDNYICIECGEVVNVDDKMREWLKIHEEIKVEYRDCLPKIKIDGFELGCGGKNCVEANYRRNPVTLEWQLMWSRCKQCDRRIIV